MTKITKKKTNLKRARDILRKNEQPSHKIRTTLYLEEKPYRAFQELCKRRNVSTSEVLDTAIQDLLEEA
ncbi:MAG: ribbon-helix-helix domain-containing protein [Oligoflexales bacterium]